MKGAVHAVRVLDRLLFKRLSKLFDTHVPSVGRQQLPRGGWLDGMGGVRARPISNHPAQERLRVFVHNVVLVVHNVGSGALVRTKDAVHFVPMVLWIIL